MNKIVSIADERARSLKELSMTSSSTSKTSTKKSNMENNMESVDRKPLPSCEASLKYMAWDVKKMAESMERMTKLFERFVGLMPVMQEKQDRVFHHQEEAPF